MTKQLQAMKLLQTLNLQSVKPVSRVQVIALREYVRIRKWDYTTYEGIAELAQDNNERHVKRILLDKDLKFTTATCKPIAVLYQYNNSVAVYVMVSNFTNKLIGMAEDTIKKLPSSIISEK